MGFLKKYLLYLICLTFFIGEGCSYERMQYRRMNINSKRYSRYMIKNRSRNVRKMSYRKPMGRRNTHKKMVIKKFGGTYIIKR